MAAGQCVAAGGRVAGAGGDGGYSVDAGGGATGAPRESCTGCARLFVPLTAANQKAQFTIDLASPVDVTGATVTFRLFVYKGSQGGVLPFVQNGAQNKWQGYFPWTDLSSVGGWQNVVTDVSKAPAAMDPTAIQVVGIEINAGGGTGPWADPTVVYVDSITISNSVAGPWLFTTDTGTMHVNQGATPVPGSAVTWLGP